MREFASLSLLTLALSSWCPAEDFAIGAPFGIRALRVYAVGASGEIALHDQTAESTQTPRVAVDPGARFAVTILGPDDLNVFRIDANRTLSVAASLEEGPDLRYDGDLALSQDGRVLLVLLRNLALDVFEFRTFVINNRLRPVWTGHSFPFPVEGEFGNTCNWAISDRNRYTGIVNLCTLQSLAILDLSLTGQITDTGQRVPTPSLHNVPFDLSADGRWVLAGSKGVTPSIAVYQVATDGTVSLHDSSSDGGASAFDVRLWPDVAGLITANFENGLSSVSLDQNVLFDGLIDSEQPGFLVPEAVDLNAAADLILIDDQSGGGEFSLFTFDLAPDGTLSPTGFSLPKNFKLADLQFIPPLTPPTLPGDANLDGLVDIADMVFLINEALPDNKPILLPQNFANADLDGDIDVDQDDLNAVLGLILNP